MNIHKDFTQYNQEQLMELIKKYNQKLYRMDTQSVLFEQIVQLRDQAQQQMDELLFLEKVRQSETNDQPIDIGFVQQSQTTPDYNSEVSFQADVREHDR